MKKIIVGSRKSQLALTQTKSVIDQLKALNLPYEFEIKEIVTKGDKILNVTLSKVGGKGLFVKEIEQALLDGEIDFAVHSMKDMPFEMPEGLTIAAIPKREDPRDCLISRQGFTIDSLPKGARIGTSSLRRAAQILSYRDDLHIKSIRGNIDTRIRKLETEGLDGIILAAAGLKRMGWEDKITECLDVDLSIPAVGQGALGIQARENDHELLELLKKIDDSKTKILVSAERSLLNRLQGGCQVPIGAHAKWEDNNIHLVGMVASLDGKLIIKQEGKASKREAVKLGIQVADKLLAKGAAKILAEVKGEE
ncbi:hydroxymethylbilane synthase [Vulcanibacillus modesticaldus]|uniref:Porphobilinogen deaminase n=1 Tax=Vulcanibacillus modesticaldus TaxID=337097 RepID=A0A1D2YSV0_9BACI|nr:hydroxymethylbilane synthase [Vulcanibacillus modesticaldus]OEF98073.1 hydroxymethylbilane synthase [Vulcanibacillus modesticaldus]